VCELRKFCRRYIWRSCCAKQPLSLVVTLLLQVDIWTLGCVLYYLWCDGAMPFGACREEREKRCELLERARMWSLAASLEGP
jgi:hypothetical protein